MKEYKYKFISSKALFGVFLMAMIVFSVFSIYTTIVALCMGVHILLVGNIVFLPFAAMCFAMLCKEIYVVTVYEHKITFKAFLRKEKVLYIAQIKNIYQYNMYGLALARIGMYKAGDIYFFDTRDEAIEKSSMDEIELGKTGVLKTGYPFKIAVNDNTTKIIREFWDRPILKVKTGMEEVR